LPIRARRLVFIIDSSGSMAGPRMVNAHKELIQAVQKLPGSTEFNIVWFNNRVGAWSPRLVSATDDAKRKAAAFVGSLVPAGSTWTYDALQAALNLKEESIYLLTDGQPTGGQLVAPDAIVAAVRRQNLLQGTSIHTIGIDTGSDESPFSRFLKSLAEQNHGQFRKVE
jgi:Mg-chelatase subunit ChlD